MYFLLLVLVLFAVVARAVARHDGPLADLEVEGDRLVLRLSTTARWMAFRRELSVPVAAVTGVRAVERDERLKLHLRLLGAGWPGFYCGLFWRSKRGKCFVVRRSREEAVEIELAEGPHRQWIVEVPTAAGAIARLDAAAAGG